MKAIIATHSGNTYSSDTKQVIIELENGDKFFIDETLEGIKIAGSNMITSHISTYQHPESVEVMLKE